MVSCEVSDMYTDVNPFEDKIYRLLQVNNISTILLLLSIYAEYSLYLRWKKLKHLCHHNNTIWNSGQLKWMLLEMSLAFV